MARYPPDAGRDAKRGNAERPTARRPRLAGIDPPSGQEQAGRRPALVISHGAYNKKVGLAVFCLITSQQKGYPFEVQLPAGLGVSGVVLSDQVKSLDWRARRATKIAAAPAAVLEQVVARVVALVAVV